VKMKIWHSVVIRIHQMANWSEQFLHSLYAIKVMHLYNKKER
jgi:hypothetical protein